MDIFFYMSCAVKWQSFHVAHNLLYHWTNTTQIVKSYIYISGHNHVTNFYSAILWKVQTSELLSFQKLLFSEQQEVTYLLKTFFSSLERDVLALCFRSLRLGYFFFFPFPFLPTLSEPRSSPVAASMSRISSASRQSTRNSEVRWESLQAKTVKCSCI